MAKHLTDEEVEIEIRRIFDSEAYKLARAEQRYRNKRREMLYAIRFYEKRGLELMAHGYTMENFKDKVDEDNDDQN